MSVIENALGKDITTRTWDTVKKVSRNETSPESTHALTKKIVALMRGRRRDERDRAVQDSSLRRPQAL